MHSGLFSLHLIDTLHSAMELLSEEGIHSIAVLDTDDNPVGLLTIQHTLDAIADKMSLKTPLSKLPLSDIVLVNLQKPISEISKLMKRTHNYKVLVTNQKGEVLGVVTAQDILKELNRKI